MLFFGVYVYERVSLQQLAQQTAERVAFTWDNSHKNITTGHFDVSRYDGLYWRLTNNRILEMFSFLQSSSKEDSGIKIELPYPQGAKNSNSLVKRKLSQGINLIPTHLKGNIQFENRGFTSDVSVELKKSFSLPSFLHDWLKLDDVTVKSNAKIVDPVELIRFTDFMVSYIPVIKDRILPSRANSLLVEPSGQLADKKVTIQSEAQAQAYLRTLVSGEKKEFVSSSGKIRQVDCLDKNGIAHQTFYTYSEYQLLEEQLPKDEELIQEGKYVKGVVWHFFRKKNQANVNLSPKFLAQIERKGIVVVWHE
jgi:hypothetical protein